MEAGYRLGWSPHLIRSKMIAFLRRNLAPEGV